MILISDLLESGLLQAVVDEFQKKLPKKQTGRSLLNGIVLPHCVGRKRTKLFPSSRRDDKILPLVENAKA